MHGGKCALDDCLNCIPTEALNKCVLEKLYQSCNLLFLARNVLSLGILLQEKVKEVVRICHRSLWKEG